jgi:hypothetical protein
VLGPCLVPLGRTRAEAFPSASLGHYERGETRRAGLRDLRQGQTKMPGPFRGDGRSFPECASWKRRVRRIRMQICPWHWCVDVGIVRMAIPFWTSGCWIPTHHLITQRQTAAKHQRTMPCGLPSSALAGLTHSFWRACCGCLLLCHVMLKMVPAGCCSGMKKGTSAFGKPGRVYRVKSASKGCPISASHFAID